MSARGLALVVLSLLSFCRALNDFVLPAGFTPQVGQNYTLNWQNLNGTRVSVSLVTYNQFKTSTLVDPVSLIASSIANTGSVVWRVGDNISPGTYNLQIEADGDDADADTYSKPFTLLARNAQGTTGTPGNAPATQTQSPSGAPSSSGAAGAKSAAATAGPAPALTTGAIVGIVVAAVLAIVLCAVVAFLVLRCRRKRRNFNRIETVPVSTSRTQMVTEPEIIPSTSSGVGPGTGLSMQAGMGAVVGAGMVQQQYHHQQQQQQQQQPQQPQYQPPQYDEQYHQPQDEYQPQQQRQPQPQYQPQQYQPYQYQQQQQQQQQQPQPPHTQYAPSTASAPLNPQNLSQHLASEEWSGIRPDVAQKQTAYGGAMPQLYGGDSGGGSGDSRTRRNHLSQMPELRPEDAVDEPRHADSRSVVYSEVARTALHPASEAIWRPGV